jgi:hypothetical protein
MNLYFRTITGTKVSVRLVKIIAFLSIFIPATGMADLFIDNHTHQYLAFYLTSTSRCLGKDDHTIPPKTPGHFFSTMQIYYYCKLKNPCFGYAYRTDNPTLATQCIGEFIGVYQIDIRQQIFNDFTPRENFTATGIGTARIGIAAYT